MNYTHGLMAYYGNIGSIMMHIIITCTMKYICVYDLSGYYW